MNWSQELLAKSIGFQHSYISKIERGEQRGSYRVLAKISQALALPWSTMIKTGEIEIPTIDDIDEYMYPALDAAFKSFHPKVKEQLMEIGQILEKYV